MNENELPVTSAAVKASTSAAVEASTEAGLPARRKSSRNSSMTKAAERAGVTTGLGMRDRESMLRG